MTDDTAGFAAELIPTSYASWRYCIEFKCGMALTPGYVEERIGVLADPGHEETQRFARTYGHDHLERVLGWFPQAQAGLGGGATDATAGR